MNFLADRQRGNSFHRHDSGVAIADLGTGDVYWRGLGWAGPSPRIAVPPVNRAG